MYLLYKCKQNERGFNFGCKIYGGPAVREFKIKPKGDNSGERSLQIIFVRIWKSINRVRAISFH